MTCLTCGGRGYQVGPLEVLADERGSVSVWGEEECPDCETHRTDASNAEHDALIRAAKQLDRIHRSGPLGDIAIPVGEGFRDEGETHFGFWVAPMDYTDAGFERFRRAALEIVDALNRDRGTALHVNINDNGTQAIVHGVVD